jgi:hypothetical protein
MPQGEEFNRKGAGQDGALRELRISQNSFKK